MELIEDIVFGGPKWKHLAVLAVLCIATYVMARANWGWPVAAGGLLAYCQGVITWVTLIGPIRLPKLPSWICDCRCNHADTH